MKGFCMLCGQTHKLTRRSGGATHLVCSRNNYQPAMGTRRRRPQTLAGAYVKRGASRMITIPEHGPHEIQILIRAALATAQRLEGLGLSVEAEAERRRAQAMTEQAMRLTNTAAGVAL